MFYFGMKPVWKARFKRLWVWLTRPFRRKPKPSRLEVAFDEALEKMCLPDDVKKEEDKKTGWITYTESRKLFKTRDQSSWHRPRGPL